MLKHLSTILLAAAGSGALLVQQEPRPQDTPGLQDLPGSSHGRSARTEDEKNSVLATFLLVHNKMEVELSRLAEQRAQDPAVKAFAQKMVAEHTQIGQKLQQFAAPVDIAGGPAQPGRPAEAGAGRTGAPGQQEFDHVGLIEELGNQFLQTSRTELEKKQGAEFDKCFINQQIMSHMQAQQTLQVLSKHASPELRQALQEELKGIKTHLDEAKQIAMTLERAEPGATRPNARPAADPATPAPPRGVRPGTPQ
jgi:putative membrane protein